LTELSCRLAWRSEPPPRSMRAIFGRISAARSSFRLEGDACRGLVDNELFTGAAAAYTEEFGGDAQSMNADVGKLLK
jgi:hypothetical protein